MWRGDDDGKNKYVTLAFLEDQVHQEVAADMNILSGEHIVVLCQFYSLLLLSLRISECIRHIMI